MTARVARGLVLVQGAPGTARALRWRPVVGVTGVLVVAALLSRLSDRPTGGLLAVTAAALGSTVVTGLHDPATRLLAAVPVSRALRRLVRLLLVAIPAVALWWVVTSVAGAPAEERSPVPLLALAAAGVAVAVWAPERYGVLVGAMVPALWFTLGLLPVGDGPVEDVARWWRSDPWPVLAVAVLATMPTWRAR